MRGKKGKILRIWDAACLKEREGGGGVELFQQHSATTDINASLETKQNEKHVSTISDKQQCGSVNV